MAHPARRVLWRNATCLAISLFVVFATVPNPTSATAEPTYSIEKIYYGMGWMADRATGNRLLVAFLNLTEGYSRPYPGNGTFDTFSQIFVEFSVPADANGPANGSGLTIRFSYYVSASCFQLNESACPLVANQTAISQDVFELQVRRILEYRDANANGSYEPGELVVQEMLLAQPQAPFVRLWPFAQNGSRMDLPFQWNVSSETENITQGALFKNDTLLDQLSNFWVSVGNGVSVNLTLDSFMFLQPTTYRGIPLTPTQLKLDVRLGVTQYFANDTALALEFDLTSRQLRFSSNATASSERVYTSSDAAEAFFTWSPNATVEGGRSVPVGSTVVVANDSVTTVFLSYPRAQSISHDPVLGLSWKGGTSIVSPPPRPISGEGAWLFVAFSVSVALTGGTVAYLLLRRRRSAL